MAEQFKKTGLTGGAGSENDWDESKHPRDENGRFTITGSSFADLSDEPIPRSLSAKAKNYDIRMPDGSVARIAEGTYITRKQVFAGAGTKKPIRDIYRLVRQYGGSPEKWVKIKAHATLEQNGKSFDAEIHWYEEPTVGKVELKVKTEI